MPEPAFAFDRQALGFDRRAGLGNAAAAVIAEKLEGLAPGAPRGILLDLGAGTGALGAHLAQGGRPYVGIDFSLGMLSRFTRKSRTRDSLLVQADAEGIWPVADGRVGILLLSRVAHLLAEEHLLAECARVAAVGALVALGSIRRDAGSLRSEMRRKMRRLLAERGVEGRSGRQTRKRLLRSLGLHGGRILPPLQAASWPVSERPSDCLAAWQGKNGLAGLPLPEDLRLGVLAELRSWALETFGSLELQRESLEHFLLEGAILGRRVTR